MSENPLGASISPAPAQAVLPRWQVAIVVAVFIGIAAVFIWLASANRKPVAAPAAPPPTTPAQPSPAAGQLMVFVRPPERDAQILPVEQKGALPVVPGGIMSLQVILDEPGFSYLVWINCEGKAAPLYPWNTKELEVKDLHQFPPLRQASRVVYSPLLGGGWTFSERGGMETVLLMARSTPLPEGTNVGELIGEPPTVALRDSSEVVILEVKDHAEAVTTVLSQSRGDDAAAKAADEPLKAMLLRLSPHFDLVRAVRFAHVADDRPALAP